MAFPTGWGRKCKITIPDAQISGSNTNFPMLVTLDHLPAEAVDAGVNSALNGGGDIRFSEDAVGTTQLACEIVSFVTNATPGSRACVIWVKLPTLNTGAAKDFYIWYNKAGETQPVVSDTYGRNSVWSDYEVVTHDGVTDSTGNHTRSTLGSPTTTAGPFGGTNDATYLNNSSNEAVRFGGLANIVAPYTIQAWGSLQTTHDCRIACIGDASATGHQGNLWAYFAGGDAIYYHVLGTGNVSVIAAGSASDRTTNVWRSYAARSNTSTDHKALLNGTSVTATSTTSAVVANADRLAFGVSADLTPYGQQPITFAEGRLRRSGLSDNWLDTEYRNQSDPAAFATAGTPEAVGGGATLSVDSTVSSHTADQVTMIHNQALTVSDSGSIHTADNVTINQGQSLTVNNTNHEQIADEPSLGQQHNLTPADTLHSLVSDKASISQFQVLAPNEGIHSHTVDVVTLGHFHALLVDGSLHGQISDQVTLSQGTTITVNDAGHTMISDNVLLSHLQALSPVDAVHTHTVDQVVLSQFMTLVVDDTAHSHAVDQVNISQGQILDATDAFNGLSSEEVALSQLHALVAANSTHGLTSEQAFIFNPANLLASPERTLILQAENRTLELPTESRTTVLPAETRTLRI